MNLGIYIQVPFCQRKCTYCNFHTGVFSRSLYEPYVDAVCRELREHPALYEAAGIRGPAVGNGAPLIADTAYVGGGTPSLLDPAALARLLDAVRFAFECALEEVTLEADPETISPEKAAAWGAAGINRISLGVQSFHDAELKAAGRMHRRDDVYRANEILRAAGFANLSFDLIAGLPHQAAESWESSLDQLLVLHPEHVSIYLLEVDEGSRLGREVLSLGARYSAPAVPSDDEMAAFYERACERLDATGYEHYEIYNWALVGQAFLPAPSRTKADEGPVQGGAERPLHSFRSRHNLKYWRREPYFGFGAGAHSFNGTQRWANAHDPAAYVVAIEQGRLPVEQLEALTSAQALEEELFLGLRQLEGINVTEIESRYGVNLAPRIKRLRDDGLIEVAGTRVRLTPSRLTVSNEAFVELLDD